MSANPNPGTHKPVPRLQNFDHRDPVGQALAQRILEQDGAADYLRFLSLGSRVPPLEALRVAGVDLATPAPVQQALALFAQRVEQLDKLL